MDIGFGPTGSIAVLAVGAVFGLLLCALLLRSACDLCGTDPAPGYVRCVVVTLIIAAIDAVVGYGVLRGVGMVATTLHLSETTAVVVSVLADLPIMAALGTLILVIALRVAPLKGFFIWLVYTLLRLLVGAVIVLLLLGGATTFDSLRRLF